MNTIVEFLKPPSGFHVRKMVAVSLICFGAIRFFELPASGNVALSLVAGNVYAFIKIALGIFLIITGWNQRTRFVGHAAAIAALAFCITAAYDALPYLNGVAVYAIMAWAMVGEAFHHIKPNGKLSSDV